MAVLSIPHFDLPFRYSPAAQPTAVVVEQDSIEDIMDCVEACLRTFIGQRLEVPDFGITDPTFNVQPLDLDLLKDEVLAQEPRAALLLMQAPDAFDQLIANVLVNVAQAQEASV